MRAQKHKTVLDDETLDYTAGRLRAYLASVRLLRGVELGIAASDRYQRGRSLIERMAICTRECDEVTMKLSPVQCADVLNFVNNSEPIEPRTWWSDSDDGPSHVVGFVSVLEAVENSLRQRKERS